MTLVVVFALAMTLLGPSASSHSGLIPRTWVRDKQVEYNYTASINRMPSGARGRIDKGAAQWNKLGGTVLFKPGRSVANYAPQECPANFQENAMHYGKIDGPSNVLALAYTCTFGGGKELFSMQILFDSGESWYTGTGRPPSGKVDLWAVATHELGHTLGILHFDSRDKVCVNDIRETMCPFYSLSGRDPDAHDVHGFSAIYGGG